MSYTTFTLNEDKFKELILSSTLNTIKTQLDKYDTIFCEDNYSENLLKKINKIKYKTISSYNTTKCSYLSLRLLNSFKYTKKHKICLYIESISNFTEFEKLVGNVLLNKTSKTKIINYFEKRIK